MIGLFHFKKNKKKLYQSYYDLVNKKFKSDNQREKYINHLVKRLKNVKTNGIAFVFFNSESDRDHFIKKRKNIPFNKNLKTDNWILKVPSEPGLFLIKNFIR